jgi:hypothetical protein
MWMAARLHPRWAESGWNLIGIFDSKEKADTGIDKWRRTPGIPQEYLDWPCEAVPVEVNAMYSLSDWPDSADKLEKDPE